MKKEQIEMNKVWFGQRMKQIRTGKNWALRGIASDSGISESDLCQIEHGNMNIRFETMLKIFWALDVTPAEFFNTDEFREAIR
jgi:transcriptional regulator with XRE-family HTH domain